MLILCLAIIIVITIVTQNVTWQCLSLMFKDHFAWYTGYTKAHRSQGLLLKYHTNDFHDNIREEI